MAVTKLSNSGIKTGVLKYDSMLAGNAAYDPAATWLISTTSVGSGGVASVTFSSIPTTYTSLQIRANIKLSGASGDVNAYIRFNGDTGANYVWHVLTGTGSSTIATAVTSTTSILTGQALANNANPGAFITDIHDYLSTTRNKTVRSFAGHDENGSGQSFLTSGLWLNTAAVSSITIITNGTGIAQDSKFSLYGMKG